MNVFNYSERVTLAASDTDRVRRHLMVAKRKSRCQFDVVVSEEAHHGCGMSNDNAMFLVLSSKNLGYDVGLRIGLHHNEMSLWDATVVEIYLSNLGEGRYTLHKTVHTLRNALLEVETIYNEAAIEHLP